MLPDRIRSYIASVAISKLYHKIKLPTEIDHIVNFRAGGHRTYIKVSLGSVLKVALSLLGLLSQKLCLSAILKDLRLESTWLEFISTLTLLLWSDKIINLIFCLYNKKVGRKRIDVDGNSISAQNFISLKL